MEIHELMDAYRRVYFAAVNASPPDFDGRARADGARAVASAVVQRIAADQAKSWAAGLIPAPEAE